MSKYKPEDLKRMAQTVLISHAAGGHQAFCLILTISMNTGLAPDVVLANIEALANV